MAKKTETNVPVEITQPEELKVESQVEGPLIVEELGEPAKSNAAIALTKAIKEETALAPSEKVDEMFGGATDVPIGSLPPQIKIMKDAGQFNVGGVPEDELTGNILFIQPHNVYYEGKYDPSDPLPPMCTSADSVKSDGGTEPQSEFCSDCKQNVYDKDLGCRSCKNRVLIYFLRDGDAFPSIIDLAATNLSKKAGEQRIMTFPARGMNVSYTAGMGQHFQLVKVKLTLLTVTFGNGSASTLNVECMDVITDMKLVKILARTTDGIKAEYKQIAKALAQEAMSDGDGMAASDDCPI